MKKVLIGTITAITIMVIAYLIIYFLGMKVDKFDLFVGWVSCMGYYISIEAYEKRLP